ncbi:MAG: LemA family protein [Terriglobia bacterium]
MQILIIIAVIVLAVILLGIYFLLRTGRSLRRAASQLDKDWSDIEVFMKQRNDDLPRLLQTCRSYMPADHPALKGVSGARSAYQKTSSIAEKSEANGKIVGALQVLFSAAGKSEGLKSNSTYLQLHSRLVELQEKIDGRCDLYNDDAARLNARLARFPGSLFTGKGALRPRPAASLSQAAVDVERG